MSLPEKQVWSQHGEDGIIAFLHSQIKHRDYRFVEIGCGSGDECNSRNLLEQGWAGVCVDARKENIAHFRTAGFDKAKLINLTVTAGTIGDLSKELYAEPDVFSLDIDSYDYFIADWLVRNGFRPKIICVETNTFLRGTTSVEYREPFSRYEIQPEYGLYFGCSEGAWKHLLKDYRYCGMESSFTNAFFIRDTDYVPEVEQSGYQTYFCEKYSMSGPELSATLAQYPVVDVTSTVYSQAYERAFT
jgi:hypothetical protein